jgi:hypothetical protein
LVPAHRHLLSTSIIAKVWFGEQKLVDMGITTRDVVSLKNNGNEFEVSFK